MKKSPQTFLSFSWKTLERASDISVPGIGHSDFGFLLIYRSMVRRKPYSLKAWITGVLCMQRIIVDGLNLDLYTSIPTLN